MGHEATRPVIASGMEVLLEGEWRAGEIEAAFDPHSGRQTTASVEERIAREWEHAERDAAANQRLLFAGPLCRFLRYESRPPRLNLWLGRTDYREYLGTKDLAEPAYRSDPLTACAALRTSDAKILVGRRGSRNMENAGWWHVMAGYVDPVLDGSGSRVDVFHTILREIEEEAGYSRAEVRAVCLGLVRWAPTHKPELIFAAETGRSSGEYHPADEEHDQIRAIDDHPNAIGEFLNEAEGRIAGPGLACLVRYTAWRHGVAL